MRTIASILALALVIIFGALMSLLWPWQPWMNAGKVVALGKWRFEDYEFQAWQRRTEFFFEPFATGLFVRRGTNQWRVFCLDIQDTYAPGIELRKHAAQVYVFRNGKDVGAFDTVTQAFRKSPESPVMTPMGMGEDSEPPGKWWLRR